MGFLEAALTLWTIPFFLLWGLVLVVCFIGALAERYWLTGFLFVATVTVLWVSGAVDFGYLMLNHYWWCLIVVGIYFGGGLAWITIRWWFYVAKVAEKRPEAIKTFLREYFDDTVKSYQADQAREMTNRLTRSRRQKENAEELNTLTVLHESAGEDEELEKQIKAMKENISQLAEKWRTAILETSIAPAQPDWLNSSLVNLAFPSDGPNSDNYLGKATDQPRFRERKRRYFSYYFYWPIDLPIYFVGTFIKDLWRTIVNWLQHYYDQHASRRIRRKIEM